MQKNISAANSVTLRLAWDDKLCHLSNVTHAVEKLGGQIVGIDVSQAMAGRLVRDVTVFTADDQHAKDIEAAIGALKGLEVVSVSDRTFLMHLGGKLEMHSKVTLNTRDDLSMAYTPGVARVCTALHEDPEKAFNLTIKKNTVAVVSDGSAVLGLGNIGPYGAMPVMEGKAVLFKQFAGVDAFPICLDTQDTESIIQTVMNIAPAFGGINLEDISAPRCFEIEKRLQEALNIPVFHDDQHGTAVVLAAALINALKLVKKKVEDLKVIVCGVGAAGVACTDIMLEMGVKQIIGVDRSGAIYAGREGLTPVKQAFADKTNFAKSKGSLNEVIKGADVFVGVSGPDLIKAEDVKQMADDAIVFALSNPVPEIMPEEAAKHAAIVATGRSDFPNQINNVLCFPGLFRGALDCLATEVNEPMKLAAAHAIANVIPEETLHPDYIVPSVFDQKVAPAVAEAVKKAAKESGVARRGR